MNDNQIYSIQLIANIALAAYQNIQRVTVMKFEMKQRRLEWIMHTVPPCSVHGFTLYINVLILYNFVALIQMEIKL